MTETLTWQITEALPTTPPQLTFERASDTTPIRETHPISWDIVIGLLRKYGINTYSILDLVGQELKAETDLPATLQDIFDTYYAQLDDSTGWTLGNFVRN